MWKTHHSCRSLPEGKHDGSNAMAVPSHGVFSSCFYARIFVGWKKILEKSICFGWRKTCFYRSFLIEFLSQMLHGAGIFTNMCPKNHPNVDKYTSTMEHMDMFCVFRLWFFFRLASFGYFQWTGHSIAKFSAVLGSRSWGSNRAGWVHWKRWYIWTTIEPAVEIWFHYSTSIN